MPLKKIHLLLWLSVLPYWAFAGTISPPYFTEKVLYVQNFPNLTMSRGQTSYQFHAEGITISTDHTIIVAPPALVKVRGKFYPDSSSIYPKYPQDIEILKPAPKIFNSIALIRLELTEKILKHHHPDIAGLIIAMTLGNKNFLNPEFREHTRIIALAHLFALSGLHMMIITAIFACLLKILKIPKRYIGLLTLPVSLFYLFLGGLGVSLKRAFLFHLLWVIASILRIPFSLVKIFWISLIFSLLVNYKNIFSISFLLSYSAVAGIIYLRGLWDNFFLHKFGNFFGNIITISLATGLATFPILILFFGQFSILFLISNILVLPFAGILIVLSFILGIGAFWNFTFLPAERLLTLIYLYINQISHIAARIPYSIIFVQHKYLSAISVILCFLLYYAIIRYFLFLNKGSYARKNMEQNPIQENFFNS